MSNLYRGVICILLIFCFQSDVSTAQEEDCGDSTENLFSSAGSEQISESRRVIEPFVFNGECESELTEVIAIRYRDNANRINWCSGTLISNRVVLTAGHCACGIRASYRVLPSLEVTKNLNKSAFGVSSIKLFPGYRCHAHTLPQPGLDYALLHLDGVSSTQKTIEFRIMNIWTARDASITRLRVVGYGLTEDGQHGLRQSADVSVLSWACIEQWAWAEDCSAFRELILSDHIEGDAAADTCVGDSGGGVFAHHNDEFVLMAVTSRGLRALGRADVNCGQGGIYGTLAREPVLKWLEANNVEYSIIGP